MKSPMTIAAMTIAASLAFGATMAAASDDYRCAGGAPRSERRSIDDARAAVEALGFRDIRRVKIEGGCYEAYAFDKNGRRVEVYVHPVSLKVVQVKDKS